MCGLLDYYLSKCAQLTADKNPSRWPMQTAFRDPHEPLLLLAVLKLIETGGITRNFIEPSAELSNTFYHFWNEVMPPDIPGNIASPFITLTASGFWHLRPRLGISQDRKLTRPSLPELQNMYFGAMIDENLFPLLVMKVSREKIRTRILHSYFAQEIHSMIFDKKEAIHIREEIPEDYDAVRLVNSEAFGQGVEGQIVDSLRSACETAISLVAVSDDNIVGHIFFSPATIDREETPLIGMGLAPMAVLPEYQKQGIGTLLVQEGIQRIKQANYPFIIVLGHARYYPRFGFERASRYGLQPQWRGVPDDAFMVLIIDKKAMEGVIGVVKYRQEFDLAM
jgi:putative acetyltransferase